jgi:hopanoid-associated sugar epimerase
MITLVTGATGHLGANLVRALLSQGHKVRALVRRNADQSALRGLDLEIVEGDLGDPASLERAVQGVTRLFHTAAMVSIKSGDREDLMRINVEGTRALMDAALNAGVQKVVHTSSFGAIGTPRDKQSGRALCSSEAHFLDPFEEATDYERSKSHSEVPVFQAAARGLDVCIVNPSAIVGPNDFRPSLVGRTIVDFGLGKMKAYIPGGFDWVPMRDVVQGHLLAMEKGKRGERYLLCGRVHTLDEIMDWLSEFTGKKRPTLRIPTWLMRGIAVVKDAIERRFFPNRTPRFNAHSIRLLTSGKNGSNEKAQRELGLTPSSVREAYKEAVVWFQQNGRF